MDEFRLVEHPATYLLAGKVGGLRPSRPDDNVAIGWHGLKQHFEAEGLTVFQIKPGADDRQVRRRFLNGTKSVIGEVVVGRGDRSVLALPSSREVVAQSFQKALGGFWRTGIALRSP